MARRLLRPKQHSVKERFLNMRFLADYRNKIVKIL
jgi:hypothetical protein